MIVIICGSQERRDDQTPLRDAQDTLDESLAKMPVNKGAKN